jgi:hypothetical protein
LFALIVRVFDALVKVLDVSDLSCDPINYASDTCTDGFANFAHTTFNISNL